MSIFNKLLAKAVIKRARTTSVASAMGAADRENARSTYILKVLKAPASIRATVFGQARQNLDSVGQKQLAAILLMFEALSSAKKQEFIEAYAGSATLAGLGTREVAYQSTWQGGNVPPHNVP